MDLIFSNYNYDIIIIGGGITGVFYHINYVKQI